MLTKKDIEDAAGQPFEKVQKNFSDAIGILDGFTQPTEKQHEYDSLEWMNELSEQFLEWLDAEDAPASYYLDGEPLKWLTDDQAEEVIESGWIPPRESMG